MKKLIALILVVFMTLTAVGCADENANSSIGTESKPSGSADSSSDDKNESSKPADSSNNSITPPVTIPIEYETKMVDGQYYVIPSNINKLYDSANCKITEEKGQYYLNIPKEAVLDIPEIGELDKTVSFESARKFSDALKGEWFSYEKIMIMNRFKRDEKGRIKICNPNKIYEPVFPEKCPVTGKEFAADSLSWDGATYSHILNCPHSFQIDVPNDKTYQEMFEKYWGKDPNNLDVSYTYIGNGAEYVDWKEKWQTDITCHETGSEKADVYFVKRYEEETYVKEVGKNAYEYVTVRSERVQITMFVESENLKYVVKMCNPSDIYDEYPLSKEYFLQFGLKPIG